MEEEIFGKLVMPVERTVSDILCREELWTDSLVNRCLLLAAIIILLISVRDYFIVFNDLMKTLGRWRWAFTIEANMSLVRSRNICFTSVFLPTILLISYYLFPKLSVLYAIGLFGGYYVTKKLVFLILESRVPKVDILKTEHHNSMNQAIILINLLSLASFVLYLCSASRATGQIVVAAVSIPLLLLFFIRNFQILSSGFHTFPTFLYLCALEISPLVVSVWLYTYYG